jgi:ferric-dicitrate binding protein FerR (iron transport regulator)
MKKSIIDILSDKKFRDGASKESIKGYQDMKEKNPELGMATLIAYVLKFKLLGISTSKSGINFSEIKRNSLEAYRESGVARTSNVRYLRIAAAASVLLFFAVGGYFIGETSLLSNYKGQQEVIEFNTPKGQQSEMTLPDGTFVALNYDSKLKYRITRNKGLQEVELEGQAFFKVTKNKTRVFRVFTANMSVNVLGTEFDVKAYKNDLKTEATLLEGSIQIKDIPGRPDPVLLKPGEKWSYDKEKHQDTIAMNGAQLSTLWRNGEFYFEKASLGEMAKTLERMYKVNIHFQDPSLMKEVYSGSVYQDEGIEDLFEIINLTVPIHVKIDEKEIWITRE